MGERRGVYRVLFWGGGARGGEGRAWKMQGVDGRIILRWICQEVGWGGGDWIEVAQVRDIWRVFVNAVMNIRVP